MSDPITRWRRSPIFAPSRPLSHPGMTSPAPTVTVNGWPRDHDWSNSVPSTSLPT